MTVSNENSSTPQTEDVEDLEGHAVRGVKAGQGRNDEETDGHVGVRKISNAGSDDDVEGNRLK